MPATASKLKRSAASTVRSWISRLPAPRDRAAYDLVVGARGLVTGKVPGEPKPPRSQASREPQDEVRPYGTVPGPRLQRTPRLPEDTVWTPFPESDTAWRWFGRCTRRAHARNAWTWSCWTA